MARTDDRRDSSLTQREDDGEIRHRPQVNSLDAMQRCGVEHQRVTRLYRGGLGALTVADLPWQEIQELKPWMLERDIRLCIGKQRDQVGLHEQIAGQRVTEEFIAVVRDCADAIDNEPVTRLNMTEVRAASLVAEETRDWHPQPIGNAVQSFDRRRHQSVLDT